jgi:hypothetical protein
MLVLTCPGRHPLVTCWLPEAPTLQV